jgi:small subunit ribosomal protein S21
MSSRTKANVSVKPRRNDHIDKTLRKFNKKVKKLKIIEEVRERRFYMKPSEKKRLQRKRSEARRLKQLRKRSN